MGRRGPPHRGGRVSWCSHYEKQAVLENPSTLANELSVCFGESCRSRKITVSVAAAHIHSSQAGKKLNGPSADGWMKMQVSK